MNILDENFPDDQSEALERKRIHVRQIGRDIGTVGMGDDDIIPMLHELDRPTFFTHDEDFCKRRLCHRAYCLVRLDVDPDLMAKYVRRVLRHPELNSKAKRMGCVIEARPSGLTLWRIQQREKAHLEWQ